MDEATRPAPDEVGRSAAGPPRPAAADPPRASASDEAHEALDGAGPADAAGADAAFKALLEYLKENRGFDFTGYKRPSLQRRIDKRMRALGIEDYAEYTDYLQVHPNEFAQLFNVILINVTGFFRDEAAWTYLGDEILPRIEAAKDRDASVRVWVAGCSSGEEAYSAAILLAEKLGDEDFLRRAKIYATDVDEDALTSARQGVYDERQMGGVSGERRRRFFDRQGERFAFRKDLRRCVIFGRHDLVQDAPISRVDLLVCRNVLMYFNAQAQGRILANFYFALAETGYLFLGKAEMLLTRSDLFTPVDLKRRVFARVPRANLRERLALLVRQDPVNASDEPTSEAKLLRERAFASGAMPQVVVDAAGSVVAVNDAAKLLFRLEHRDVGRPLHELEISYRPVDLRSALERAYATRLAVVLDEVEWQPPGGDRRLYQVQVTPLHDGGGVAPVGASITYQDRTSLSQMERDLRSSQQELETAYEEVESTNEELETTNEELQSTVEELETTNEELQSTNEELETMNEELQSTNEELQSMNEELRHRGEELNEVNAFLESIYGSLRYAMVVVDPDFRVRVWNGRATELWGLRRDEAEGTSFASLDIGLPVQPLEPPIRAALGGAREQQELEVGAHDRRGKPIRCRVTVGPLLGSDGEVRGAILFMAEEPEG
jgi:two-component system CheB/CheR fusion protein